MQRPRWGLDFLYFRINGLMNNFKQLEADLISFIHDSEILKVEWDKTDVSSSLTITVLMKNQRYQVICTDIIDFNFNLDNGFTYIEEFMFYWIEKDNCYYLSIDPYNPRQGISEKDNCVVICRQMEVTKVV